MIAIPRAGRRRSPFASRVHQVLTQVCLANVLTLSCKSRLTCLPREAARRLPRLTRSGGSDVQPA